MADSVDIDLYDNIEDEFNQDAEFGGAGDLYDDVITAGSSSSISGRPPSADSQGGSKPHGQHSSSSLPSTASNYTGKKFMLYIGNLTWWTTDQDLTDAIVACGVGDLLEIKFNENRANGQSKGFALVIAGSEQSSRLIFERLAHKELHGQVPQIMHYSKQALSQFEAQARKGGELPQNGNFRDRERDDLNQLAKTRGPPTKNPGQPAPQPGRPVPGPFPPRLQPPPPGPPRPGMPVTGPLPPGPHLQFAPPPGSLPSVTGPPPGSIPGLPPRPGMPPPGAPRMDLGPPRLPPPGPRGPPPMDHRGPPPRGEWDPRIPGAPFPPGGPPPTQPIPPPGVRPPAPNVRPFVPGGPPPGLPPVSSGALGGPPPAPHVNPAFFAPPPSHAQAPMPVMGHPPPPDPYSRPPPGSHPDQYGRPIPESSPMQRRHEPPPPAISEQEFEEIFQRNKTVSSSAINRAVMDASSGDFASAIETLVTAISLIKQSKIASDDRCKILISSLQDTLHGIEEKSYGGSSSRGGSSGRRSRSRERERDRERGEKRSRSHRSRSREREYRERSRERDRHYDDRHRERERSERERSERERSERERSERERSDRDREREYASSSSGRSRH